MVDLAKEAFSTNNFGLAAEIYERTIQENGPKSDLYLGMADSLARGGRFSKAFDAYTKAYRYGKVTPEKLKHLVTGLIGTIKNDMSSAGNTGAQQLKKSGMFTCGLCRGLLTEAVTIPCGHTFCRKCLEKDKSKTCGVCGTVHYRLKVRSINCNVTMTNVIEKWFPSECEAARLKREGNGHFEKRDFKLAIEVYSKAIEIASSDHLLLSNRCHAHISLDQFSEALKDAEEVVKLRPDWPKGYFRKGSALYGLGKYEDAVVAFLQCLALDEKVTSARDCLSKALDKILSALPPDDPKAQALQQQKNPTLLQQLIEGNFNTPSLLPVITHKLTDLARIVRDTLDTADNFSQEPAPSISSEKAADQLERSERSHGSHELKEEAQGFAFQNFRCSSLPDCSDVDHMELQKAVMPRSHSPRPASPITRKRLRNSSTACPMSPTRSSPQKVSKSTYLEETPSLSATTFPVVTATANCAAEHQMKPEQMNIEDLECGLCYRVFYEPVSTPCGHTFCRKCLDRCLDHTVICPMCKGNLAEYLAERRQAVTESISSIIETYFKKEHLERCKINDEEMVELTRMGCGQQSDIPIFVCTVTYPTIPCPLHIFEPRYRFMVRQCMESGTRQFGMCMHTSNSEEDFAEYGCMLEIRDVQYFPDGRSVVDTVGGRRFKVLSRGKRDGYNTAKVEFITDTNMDAEELQAANMLQTEVFGMVKEWVKKLPTVHRARIAKHYGECPALDATQVSPGNGPQWAWWAIAVLPLNPQVQITLLSMTSYKHRLTALKKVLVYINRRGSR